MERALLKIEKAVVDEINSGVPPPNAPSTIKAKNSSKTLVDSGEMRNHVDHKITGEGILLRGEVGFFDEKNAEKAQWNEYGTRDKAEFIDEMDAEKAQLDEHDTRGWHIPPRPFLRPAYDKSADGAIDEMAEEVFAQVEKELGW